MTAVLDGPFTYAAPPVDEHATFADVMSQVSELCRASSSTYKALSASELADLRERQGKIPRRRTVLDEPGKRRRKYEIETGIYRDGNIGKPLEPWTYPGSRTASMGLYFQVMNGEVNLSQVKGADRAALKWMADEQLIAVDEHGQVLPLSDARSPERRDYPGANVPDRRAKIGLYLREFGKDLTMAALVNISQGKSVRRSRKTREVMTSDGIAITAARVCTEANRIKRLRADLDGYRYLSLKTCQRIIKTLILAGTLDEISSPKPVRRQRSWWTLPRIIKRLAGGPTPASPDPDHESRQESR